MGTLVGTVETWRRFRLQELGPYGALLESAEPIARGELMKGRLIVRGRRQEVIVEVCETRPVRATNDRSSYFVGLAFPEEVSGPIIESFRPRAFVNRAPPAGGERRRGWRAASAGEAEFAIGAWANVEIRDLSLGGTMFASDTALRPGTRGELRSRLAEHGFATEIEVRRIARGEAGELAHRIAASFVSLDDRNRRTVAAFLKAARP